MIQTKFNESRFVATDPAQAMGMFLAKPLVKSWKEDIPDTSTGEVVTIDRNEILMKRGTEITNETAQTINFYIQTGDITEFEVTDQLRAGYYEKGYIAAPWVVTACVKDKNRKFILYAKGVEQALEIAKDYIELKFPGCFEFVGVKGFNDCIAICDNFNRGGAENDVEMPTDDGKEDCDGEATRGKFYLLELHVEQVKSSVGFDRNFLVFTKDAEQAKILAETWLTDQRHKEVEAGNMTPDEVPFVATIKTATLVNCYCVIPPDFTREYFKQEKAQKEAEQSE